jgi:hypothetical protein
MLSRKKPRNMRTAVAWHFTLRLQNITAGDIRPAA